MGWWEGGGGRDIDAMCDCAFISSVLPNIGGLLMVLAMSIPTGGGGGGGAVVCSFCSCFC
jgi:hypothetical protein